LSAHPRPATVGALGPHLPTEGGGAARDGRHQRSHLDRGHSMNWYLDVLKKYTQFEGRARRTEYWMFFLFNFIISIVLSLLERVLGLTMVLSAIYSLAVLLPALAVSVRRLHDTNRSGWLLLLAFIPIIGFIVLLVFALQEGQAGPNQYGPNPKAAPAA
jgi:uncharacterized membrane protein YhaH (DUF805 family)